MNRLRAGTVGDHSALGKGALVKSPDSPLPGDRLEPEYVGLLASPCWSCTHVRTYCSTPRAQASKPSANPPPVVNSIIHQVEEKTRQRDKEFDSSRHRRARFVVEGPNGRAYGPKMPIMSPIKPQPPGSARQHEPHHARDYDEHPAPPYDVLNATRGSTATVGMSQSRSSHRSSTFFEVAPKPPVLPPVLLRLFNDSHGDQVWRSFVRCLLPGDPLSLCLLPRSPCQHGALPQRAHASPSRQGRSQRGLEWMRTP